MTIDIDDFAECQYASQCPLSGDSCEAEENRDIVNFLSTPAGKQIRYEILGKIARAKYGVKESDSTDNNKYKAAETRSGYGS